nr:MAG TPA: hypothetical protein [Caudoviricetes sp.]
MQRRKRAQPQKPPRWPCWRTEKQRKSDHNGF